MMQVLEKTKVVQICGMRVGCQAAMPTTDLHHLPALWSWPHPPQRCRGMKTTGE